MSSSASRLAWCGVILAAAASPAAAFVVTATNDAFDLGAALAPSPTGLVSVTGQSVDFGGPASPGQFGTFTDGNDLLGFANGIVLSTGNAASLGFGAGTQSTDFGRAAATDFTDFVAGAFASGVALNDVGRFTVSIDPGLAANYVNFRLGFGTNENGLIPDFAGVFVNGTYLGQIGAGALDRNHPWAGTPSTGFGFATVVFPDGTPTAFPSFVVSMEVPEPGQGFTLDFVVADATDGILDTALFLGEMNGSLAPLGTVAAVPEPSAAAALAGLVGLLAATGRRRRTA